MADTSSNMALMRTRLAAERTLMAWVRTAFSMISFGFTIGKVFQYLNEHEAGPHRTGEGRMLALGLITLGLISLFAGSWEYHRTLGRLESLTSEPDTAPLSIMTIVTLVLILAIAAFVGIFVHIRS